MLIRDALRLRGIRYSEQDIIHIQSIMSTIQDAQVALYPYCDLNEEVPIVVVDPEVLKNE